MEQINVSINWNLGVLRLNNVFVFTGALSFTTHVRFLLGCSLVIGIKSWIWFYITLLSLDCTVLGFVLGVNLGKHRFSSAFLFTPSLLSRVILCLNYRLLYANDCRASHKQQKGIYFGGHFPSALPPNSFFYCCPSNGPCLSSVV